MPLSHWFQRLTTNLSITGKIACGYGISLGIALLGTGTGLVAGSIYENEAQAQLYLAHQQIKLLQHLDDTILQLRSYPQTLMNVADDSIWFAYENSRFDQDIQLSQSFLRQLEELISLNSKRLTQTPNEIYQLVQDYQKVLNRYQQLLNSLWSNIDPLIHPNQSSDKVGQQILTHLNSDEAKQINIQFERLSEQVAVIELEAENNYEEAIYTIKKANDLQLKIIIGSMVLSTAIAIMLACTISRAIARPLKEVTKVAQSVTKNADFQQKVPIRTRDEVGRLAASLNQLIRWIRQYIRELEEANNTLEKRVLERTIELEQAKEDLERLANLDDLTQLFNRRYFTKIAYQEWERAKRYRFPISLILCDVDYFKSYNDTYGHPEGDQCLYDVAQAISRSVQRPSDVVARFGGEEFIVLLPNINLSGAIAVAQRIKRTIAQLKLEHEGSSVNPYITLSMGVFSLIPTSTDELKDFISQTDQLLYQAKENGRNQIVSPEGMFSPLTREYKEL